MAKNTNSAGNSAGRVPVQTGAVSGLKTTGEESIKTSDKIIKTNQQVMKSITGIAKGFVTTGASVALTTKKTGEYGKYVDSTSKQLGMSAKAFQEWDYIMSANNVNIADLVGCMGVLEKQISGVRKGSNSSMPVFDALGVSVKDVNGQFRAQEDIFSDCISAVQGIQDPAERAIMAQRLFGEETRKLAPLLDGTYGSVQQLKKEYASMGIGLSDEDILRAVELSESMNKLGKVFELVGVQLGVALLPSIQQFADTIVTHLPAIQSTVVPVFEMLNNVLCFSVSHIKELTAVASAAGAIFATAFLTSTAILSSTSLAIGAVILTITELILHFKDFCAWCNKAKDAAVSVFNILPSKKSIEVETVTSNTVKAQRHALGTSFSSGGLSWVGESGPELVNLRRGDSVIPADKSAQIANGGNTINISMNVQGNLLGNREFFNEMMNMMAVEFSCVQ